MQRLLLFAVLCALELAAQVPPTIFTGYNQVTGQWDASSATRTNPSRAGTGSPDARDACLAKGESYFQTDATVGQNVWLCTTPGTPGTWTQWVTVGTGTVTTTGSPASPRLAKFSTGTAITNATAVDVSATSYIAGGGTAQVQTATYSPAVPSLATGLQLCWIPVAANTAAAPTFSPNGLTAKPITKYGTTALVANNLTTAAVACAIYDGTEWQLQNPQINSANLRTCSIVIGSDDGSALVDADLGPQGQRCMVPYASTVVEVDVYADADVPQVIVRKLHGVTYTNLVSGALATAASGAIACASTNAACFDGTSKSGTVSIVTAASANVLAAGDTLGLTSGTAGGVAKRMSINIVYSVN